jgi:hypothetical protein
MTAGDYAVAVMLLGCVGGSLGIAGLHLRWMLLPSWSGAPARVAEAVIAIAILVLVSEILGCVGAFKRWPVVLACAAIAGGIAFVSRRAGGARDWGAGPVSRVVLANPHQGRLATAAALVAVALVLTQWLHYALGALHTGMREFDTVTYHMPFATTFVQRGSLTGLQYDGNPPVSFYPFNSELIHAVGILVVSRDLLSPVLNLFWLALALLSGWCIGRPLGVAPGTLAATALAASQQVVVSSQAGTAKNDMVAVALLLAAGALLMNGRGSREALVLAALAGGLAVGTRLNLWASVLPLLAFGVASAGAGRRSATAAWCTAGVVVGGGFWYLRNLLAVGNPLPWFGVRISGLVSLSSTTPPVDCGRTTVAHYLTKPSFVSAHLLPALTSSVGPRWWAVLALATVAIAAGLASGVGIVRVLAAVALTSAVAYILTPAGAGGVNASCFAFNLRFALPALTLALIVLPLVLSRLRMSPLMIVLIFLIVNVVNARLDFAPAPVLATVGIVAGAVIIWQGSCRRLPGPVLAGGIGLALVLAAAGGWHEQQVYLRSRYSRPLLTEPVEPIASALRSVRAGRVAVSGFVETYPLYGADLSHRVELPAARVQARFHPDSTTCRGWLLALEHGRYDYVVIASAGRSAAPAAYWTLRYPGMRVLLASPPGFTRRGQPWRWQLFHLRPSPRLNVATACGGALSR